MSWPEVFPLLDEEMVKSFEENASSDKKKFLDEWFAVKQIINNKENRDHLVAVSLFWKRDMVFEADLTDISRDSMINARQLGLVERFAPWETYVLPILECADILSRERPGATLRVYLANDLSFLINDLVERNCEVYLMASDSIRHNPGAMWRFLALEDSSTPVTITDADRARLILADISRTEAAFSAGIGGWRVPYHFSGSGREGYRPINASQFGSARSYPMRQLMHAFIWHSIEGTMPTKCNLEGLRESEIAGTIWPNYGFDEWFLLAVLYPRMAFEGLLTFFPWDHPQLGQFFTLDIEYCTWANSSSELINYPNEHSNLDCKPWSSWDGGERLRLREGTVLVKRLRKQTGPGHRILEHARSEEIEKFYEHSGDLRSLLQWVECEVLQPWWIDFNPLLQMGDQGAELFLDRRYENTDVVFCGYYFIKVTSELSAWAFTYQSHSHSDAWIEGKLLRVPKLEGPMTLWNTEFSRRFYAELNSHGSYINAEILLRAWIDLGIAKVTETTAKQMGWNVR